MNDGFSGLAETLSHSMAEQNNNLITIINKQNEKLIDYITNKDQLTVNKHDDALKSRMKLSGLVLDKIKTILYKYQADRIMILEFHNSYNNLSGIPFAKYSCTFEYFKTGHNPLIQKIMNMPFSTITPVVKNILESHDRQAIYKNIEDDNSENNEIFSLIRTDDAKGLIFNALYNNKNEIFGLLVLEYHDNIPGKLDYDELNINSAEIASVLSLNTISTVK